VDPIAVLQDDNATGAVTGCFPLQGQHDDARSPGGHAVLRFVDVVAELYDGTGLSLAENMQVGQPL